MHQLYKIIRLLAPKQRYRKVQLYGKDGQMLSRDQEVDEFRTHFSKVFQGNALDAVIQTGTALPYSPLKRYKRLSTKFLHTKPLLHIWPLAQFGAQQDMVFLSWWPANFLSFVPTPNRVCLRVGKMAG